MNVQNEVVVSRDDIRLIDLSKFKVEKQSGRTVLAAKSSTTVIQVDWLAQAAETYRVSADPRDYVIAEMPLVTADVPNRNLDCFPLVELTRFCHKLGRPVYASFIGKPTFQDHNNRDPGAAKGVNFDAVLRQEPVRFGYKGWKVRVLSGYDRTKDRSLANEILSGRRRGFSMGADVAMLECSVCNSGPVDKDGLGCMCIGGRKGSVVGGVLKYNRCFGVNFIENSSVGVPADNDAHMNEWW